MEIFITLKGYDIYQWHGEGKPRLVVTTLYIFTPSQKSPTVSMRNGTFIDSVYIYLNYPVSVQGQ